MKKVDKEFIQKIYQKTDGKCHLCSSSVAISNYAKLGFRGAWEIDHSRPKARGGTDNLNNLFPAHISCNRIKRDKDKRSIRRQLSYKTPESSNGIIGPLLVAFGLYAIHRQLSNNKIANGGEWYV